MHVLHEKNPWRIILIAKTGISTRLPIFIFYCSGSSLFRDLCRLSFLFALILSLNIPAAIDASALEPPQILVLSNVRVPDSIELARYYMKKRGVPNSNLLQLDVTCSETCSRDEYNRDIATPVRNYLKDAGNNKIRCILIMYGLPLKIAPTGMSPEMAKKCQRLRRRRERLEGMLSDLGKDGGRAFLKGEIRAIDNSLKILTRTNTRASVDSEIALVMYGKYDLAGWMRNPFYVGYRDKGLREKRQYTLMVSRLDGPAPATVRRIIDDSLVTENNGLKGKAYFDARWSLDVDTKDTRGRSAYKRYDLYIHQAASLIKKMGVMPVVIDSEQALFKRGECQDAAIYCGWYSLARYVDAFRWVRGSVGYHIASSECSTLKRFGSHVWCKRMLEKGVAATLGPVYEPYLQAFPPPHIFYRFLLDGYFTLAECFALSKPFCSWQMVLIGDPLYRPFMRKTGHD